MSSIKYLGPLGILDNPFIETAESCQSDAVVAAVVANELRVSKLPRLAAGLSTATVKIFVGAAAGNIDVAIFSSTDGGTNMTREASTGSTVVAGANAVQSIALVYAWRPGVDYFTGFVADNVACTLGRLNNGSTGSASWINACYNRAQLKGAVGIPIPASIAGGFSQSASIFWIGFV